MKKLFFVLMAVVTLCLVACDDKDNDNKQEVPACDVAACEMAENAAEMACDDAGACIVKACNEGFHAADDAKACVADEAPKCEGDTPACDPACEGSDCICRDGAWACVPVDVTDKCDPKCPDGKKCECTNDVCACADVNPPVNECDGKAEGDECAEGKTCQKEGEALACKDKPADPPAPKCDPACDEATQDCVCDADKCECKTKDAPAADPCEGKAEGDVCGENKTCQKGEGDKLECKDKPADQAPAE